MAGPIDSAGPNDAYLVGSDGYGYFSLSFAAAKANSPTTFTQFSDSTIALYTASVSRIVDDNGMILMGTNGAGLWRASFNPATGAISSAWDQE